MYNIVQISVAMTTKVESVINPPTHLYNMNSRSYLCLLFFGDHSNCYQHPFNDQWST